MKVTKHKILRQVKITVDRDLDALVKLFSFSTYKNKIKETYIETYNLEYRQHMC